jgi:Caspase domain
VLTSVSLPALAEKRVALLIGNEAYASAIGRLSNPHNDVALLERALKGLGFEVLVERDVGLGALTRAVNGYARRLRSAGPNARQDLVGEWQTKDKQLIAAKGQLPAKRSSDAGPAEAAGIKAGDMFQPPSCKG